MYYRATGAACCSQRLICIILTCQGMESTDVSDNANNGSILLGVSALEAAHLNRIQPCFKCNETSIFACPALRSQNDRRGKSLRKSQALKGQFS